MKSSSSTRNSGFTLVEIMVVLGLAAVISSITLGAFRSISDGNKRTSCQSNLSQIYQSCRVYSQDYDGKFPYLNAGGAPPDSHLLTPDPNDQDATPKGGLGLWALYVYPKPSSTDCITQPNYYPNLPLADDTTKLAGYIKSTKVFHCPADNYDRTIKYLDSADACQSTTLPSGTLSFNPAPTAAVPQVYLNAGYLSYQIPDNNGPTTNPSPDPKNTYSSFRNDTSRTRQLIPFAVDGANVTRIVDRPMRNATVVTWCRFHRSMDSTGKTKDGGRKFDNVLFSDGSVQSLPFEQEVTDTAGNTNKCYGWQRVPRDLSNSLSTASSCHLDPP